MMRITAALATIGISLAVAGCGGGGGGGSGGGGGAVRPSSNFTSFRSVGANQSTQVSAVSQRIDAVFNANNKAVSTTLESAKIDDVSVTASTGASRQVTALTVSSRSTSSTNAKWGSGSGGGSDSVARCGNSLCVGNSPSATLAYANPNTKYWDYQTYGLWLQQDARPRGFAVALSVGAATPGTSIPTAGTATYRGNTVGVNAAANGDVFVHSASFTAAANFGTRTIDIQTTGTTTGHLDTSFNTAVPASHLDITGRLAYERGVNSFSGTVTSTGGMRGTATGRFYGPNAQEIGGVYGLEGAGAVEKMTGSFGGATGNR